MSWRRQFLFRLLSLFRKEKLDAEMAEEMRLHVELRTQRNIETGMAPDEALYASQRVFGNVGVLQEKSREARGWSWVDQIRRDFLYAIRLLRRSPTFTATTITSLALCLGVNAAIFSVLHALVIRPLPFAAAEDIVEIYTSAPKVGLQKLVSNIGQYTDFKANAPAFATVALWDTGHDALTDTAGAVRLPMAVATAELFPLLGLQPIAGRFFGPEHHEKSNDKVIVLTESFWRSRFGGEVSAIGQTVRLNQQSYEIIGVAPRVFESFDARVKAVRPYSMRPDRATHRSSFYVTLFGRIAPGASLSEARTQVTTLEKKYYDMADVKTRDFLARTDQFTVVDRVQEQRRGPLKGALWLLQAGAGLVLLIGVINVINLFLARSHAREREFRTRAALGASRGAILRQLVVEAGVIGILGMLGGLALAWATLHAANSFAAILLPSAPPFGLGSAVFEFTALTGLAITAVVAVAPAIRALQQAFLGPSLQTTDRGATSTRRTRWVAGSLVVGQIAFALVLSVAAGLLVRSFLKVLAQPPGFDPEHVVTARIDFNGEQEKTLPARIEAAMRTVPGLDGCVATSTPFLPVPGYPFSMAHSGTLSIHGDPGSPWPGVFFCGVSADYARVMGVRLVQGRWFNETDVASGRAVVVDETFARRHFPGQDPIGRRIAQGSPKAPPEEWPQIIGVAANVRHNGAEDRSGVPFTYFSREQNSNYGGSASILIRTSRPPEEVIAILRRLIREIDPTIPLYAESTMQDVIKNSRRHRQGITLLLTAFAGLALLLSAVGVYGVLAYDVSRRTREIGVRLAVGASRGQIIGMIVRDGGSKTVMGVIIGLAVALAANRGIAALLFDVAATDVWAYALSAAVLILTAVLAAWLPARRAGSLDPVAALRAE